MTVRSAFIPARGQNVVVSPSVSSASSTIGAGNKSLRLVNSGTTNICYVRVGAGAQTATTADTPVLPNSSVIIAKGQDEDTVAYISASGTTLNIQPGEGGI